MRENRTSGSVRGAPGNRRSYHERLLRRQKYFLDTVPQLRYNFIRMEVNNEKVIKRTRTNGARPKEQG